MLIAERYGILNLQLKCKKSETTYLLIYQNVTTRCTVYVQLPRHYLRSKILNGEMKDVMVSEVWWLLMVDTTWGTKSHLDKISVSRKLVLLHF